MNAIYYVYIITNHTNTVLYTGMTNNIVRRLYEHRNAVNKSNFSALYRLYKLIWFQEFRSAREAIIAEKRIKGWTRKKKIDLIVEVNPDFKDCSST